MFSSRACFEAPNIRSMMPTIQLIMVVQTAQRTQPAGLSRSDRSTMRSASMEFPCPLVLAGNRDFGGSVRDMSSSWLDEQLRRIGAAPPASAADPIDPHRLPTKWGAHHARASHAWRGRADSAIPAITRPPLPWSLSSSPRFHSRPPPAQGPDSPVPVRIHANHRSALSSFSSVRRRRGKGQRGLRDGLS
jgi:hypothetical protein